MHELMHLVFHWLLSIMKIFCNKASTCQRRHSLELTPQCNRRGNSMKRQCVFKTPRHLGTSKGTFAAWSILAAILAIHSSLT